MQTQQYLIIMRDDTPTTEKTSIFLDRVRIPNNVIDSCQKHYKIHGRTMSTNSNRMQSDQALKKNT